MYRIYALILCLCLVGCTQKKDIEVSTQKENFSYEEVSENFSKLQCGDIINIENSHYISNIAIPGRWKHTLIYLSAILHLIKKTLFIFFKISSSSLSCLKLGIYFRDLN